MSPPASRCLVIVFILVFHFSSSSLVSSLLIKNETAVSLGSTIHLPCSFALAGDVDDEEVDLEWRKRRIPIWQKKSYFTSETWDSSKFGLIGIYDLLITNVSYEDAGDYVCVKDGFDDTSTNKWTVHVLGHPTCQVVIPERTNFVREGHNVSLECRLRFSGSVRNKPEVQWQTAGESATLGDDQPSKEEDKFVRTMLNMTVTKEDDNRESEKAKKIVLVKECLEQKDRAH